MKNVTIPGNMKPWTCRINGVVYEYEPGEKVNVPDAVAAVIEAWERAQPKEDVPEPENVDELTARLKSGTIADAELHLGFYLDNDGLLCVEVEENENEQKGN